MAIHDYIIENQTGINFRADLNLVLAAIVSNNSNLTEPTTKFAYMWWVDTTAGLLKQRNSSNTAWVDILNLTTGASVSTSINDLTNAILDVLGNIGMGLNVLVNNTTGNNNVAMGGNALANNTTGDGNVVLGKFALTDNTTGNNNVAVGLNALVFNTTGNFNIAMGYEALLKNIVSYNTAIGHYALNENTTGSYNIALGLSALKSNTTGNYNVAVGYNTLYSNIIGVRITAIGYEALFNNTSNDNTAIGHYALNKNTTGFKNTAVGESALENNTIGNDCTAIGASALENNTIAGNNTAIGKSALSSNTTGFQNTALGAYALQYNTTGTANTILGAHAGANMTTGTNYSIAIGDNVAVIGSHYLTFGKNNGADRVYNQFNANATWTRASDDRIKKDIETNEDCGLAFINDLRTVTYKFKAPSELDADMSEYDKDKDKPSHDKPMYGFIAQEVKEVLDNHKIKNFSGWHIDENGKDKLQGISYEMFVMPLVKAVQELSKQNKTLEDKIDTLLTRIEALENLTR